MSTNHYPRRVTSRVCGNVYVPSINIGSNRVVKEFSIASLWQRLLLYRKCGIRLHGTTHTY